MSELPAETLDRLLAGELSAVEQRRLAQQALDDPELFDILTAAATIASARDHEKVPEPAADIGRTATRYPLRRLAIAAAALAATVVLAIGYRWQQASTAAPSIASPPNTVATSAAPAIEPPVLLTARLATESERPPATFRTDDSSRRMPKPAGTINSVENGIVEADIGSLDGVTQGTVLPVFRSGNDGGSIGRVTVTTVFRERVRGRTDDRGIRTGDRIDVPPAVHVAALLEEVAARRSVGDLAGARTVAAAAATRAQEASVSADVRRRALAELGTIEHALGARDESARHLRAAVDELDAAPPASPAERAEILNELGTVEIEQRDYAAADRSLQAAQTLADGATRIRVMNNLGAVASLRGNRDAAVALYRQAQSLAAGAADLAAERAAIGKNLDALARAR